MAVMVVVVVEKGVPVGVLLEADVPCEEAAEISLWWRRHAWIHIKSSYENAIFGECFIILRACVDIICKLCS
jgi:hypothetical protein